MSPPPTPSPPDQRKTGARPLLMGALLGALIGMLLGSAVGHLIGGYYFRYLFEILGALAGFGYRLIPALQQQIADAEQRLRTLATAPSAVGATPTTPVASAAPSPAPATNAAGVEESFGRLGVAVTASPAARAASGAAEKPSWQEAPAQASGPSLFRRATSFAVDWFKRGNPIARVGVVILFFGGAFLAKYAVELNLFPLELRLVALGVGAMVLLGLGWRLRARRRQYALILQGGGIAVLYLTVYASLRLYHLIPPGAALLVMIVVALAAAVLAVAQNAIVLAVIGFAGGFAAPILASTGGGDHVALFSYYAVLNLGVFAIAWFRAWRVLNLVGFVFTFGITALWRALRYTQADLVTADFFLLLFFVLYIGVSILFSIRQPPRLKGYVSGSLVFGLPVVAFSLQASLMQQVEYGLAWSAFGFGLCYLVLAWVLFLTRNDNLRLLAEAFAALGVIFGSLAVPLAFDPDATSAIWAVEGAGLLWLGVRQQRKLARAFGVLLQLGAGWHYLLAMDGFVTTQIVLNSACMGALGLAVAGYLSGFWLQRDGRAQLAAYEQVASPALLLWSLGWWLFGGFDELARAVPDAARYGAVLSLAATTALLLHGFGRRLAWNESGILAVVVAAVTLGFGMVMTLAMEQPLSHGGYFGWPAAFLTHLWLLSRQEQGAGSVVARTLPGLHALALWALVLVTTREAHWQVARELGGVWPDLVSGAAPGALLWLAARGPAVWPLLSHRASYRYLGGIPIVIWLWLWIVGVNLGSRGDPAPLPYLPLLNPLDMTVLLVELVMLGWWLALSSSERQSLNRWSPRLLPVVAGATTFLWLNAALIRALHYGMGTPLYFDGAMHSFVVQAALSIFWSMLGFAAMIVATRRRLREVWLAGAALMAVVVAKLFLVDLEGSGTLARIVSFISVGALLLITGYFSPLPPKTRVGAESTEGAA